MSEANVAGRPVRWKVTKILDEALVGGYIGEVEVRLTPLMDAMAGQKIRPFTLYYYGQRDEELSERFGYPLSST